MKVKAQPQWDEIPRLYLDNILWTEDTGIRAEGQLCCGGDALYVHMRAVEKDIRAEYKEQLSPVFRDSCLEFYFMPGREKNYFNIEMNANGCMTLQYGRSGPDRFTLVRENEKEYFDIRTGRTPDGWEIFYRIPLGSIRLFCPDFSFEGALRANMYSCGGNTRHFLSWAPVHSEKPDFHRPQDFGTMRFVREDI